MIKSIISEMSPSDARDFLNHFTLAMDRAYSWDLWAAAYFVRGGCGDDSFSDFRASLISRGENTFTSTINNPDVLANEIYDEDLWFFEGFDYAVSEAVEAVAGDLELSISGNTDPSGEEWEEGDLSFFEKRFPKLWEMYSHEWATSASDIEELNKLKKLYAIKPWWKFW